MRESDFEPLSLTGNGTFLTVTFPEGFTHQSHIFFEKAILRKFSLHSSRKSFENLQFKIFKVSLKTRHGNLMLGTQQLGPT